LFFPGKSKGPTNDWHSFDSTPWLYPWLTFKNISKFRGYSDTWLSKLELVYEARGENQDKKYGFIGNMANNLYARAVAISHRKLNIDLFIHPHDSYLMSHPAWEEYDGEVPADIYTVDSAKAAGILLPEIDCLRDNLGTIQSSEILEADLLNGMRKADLEAYRDYFAYMPTLTAINQYDALLSIQAPYLAYLSGAPYCATQMGGEVWYECSRNDIYGMLQRASYANSKVFLFSNPWSLSFARRYKFSNLIYVPMLISEDKYSPGHQEYREEWMRKTGGDFFVLMTSRVDYKFKGTDIALDGFAKFSNQNPGARLVLIGWGDDFDRNYIELKKRGLENKVLILPMTGKLRLIKYLRSADCVIDQLTIGYYGASALEALACGKPLIMKINCSQYNALLHEGAPPVCNSANAVEVFDSLVKLHSDGSYKELLGIKAREWFMKTHSNEKWGKVYEMILWAVAENALPKFNFSPLKRIKTWREVKYLENERKNAPIFPNYF
jgi:glycosyltransferase involved in cell wall biosynthesis